MDLINVLQRLNAISEESKKKPDDDNDGVPNWADKKPGADDTDNKKKANEDIMNVMRGLKAIQEDEDEQGVAEGYYDLNDPGMQPIDLSANPPFSEIVDRYSQLYYQSHEGEYDDEESAESDAIEQYVAKRFGEKGSAHLQKAAETSRFGRDDKPYGRDGARGDNLGRPSQRSGDFRTTKAGKMHGQDANVMKNKISGRLGRHPEPSLPEGAMDESLNTYKLADIMGVDAQQLRAAAARASAGKQTRSDIMLLSDTFVKLINMPDDTAIQKVANLIKSGNPNKPDVEEGNEFSGAFNECGDMPMDMGAMSPLSMTDGGDETDSTQSMGVPTAPEAKDRYTLSITKADGTTLNATTDVPDELAALMKAVGMSGKAAVAPAQQGAEEVEEEFGNTPDATNERDPRSHGQTKDWGLPGRGAGKPEYPGTRASGDNPMSESMFKEYLKFKSGK